MISKLLLPCIKLSQHSIYTYKQLLHIFYIVSDWVKGLAGRRRFKEFYLLNDIPQ